MELQTKEVTSQQTTPKVLFSINSNQVDAQIEGLPEWEAAQVVSQITASHIKHQQTLHQLVITKWVHFPALMLVLIGVFLVTTITIINLRQPQTSTTSNVVQR